MVDLEVVTKCSKDFKEFQTLILIEEQSTANVKHITSKAAEIVCGSSTSVYYKSHT